MRLLFATAAVLIAATLTSAANADYYGGVTPTVKAQVVRAVYARWHGSDAQRMLCIIGRESGYNPRAQSRTGDSGLAQINQIHARVMGALWRLRYSIEGNLDMALRLFLSKDQYGHQLRFRPWAGGSYYC